MVLVSGYSCLLPKLLSLAHHLVLLQPRLRLPNQHSLEVSTVLLAKEVRQFRR
jgi:hypothetical protein